MNERYSQYRARHMATALLSALILLGGAMLPDIFLSDPERRGIAVTALVVCGIALLCETFTHRRLSFVLLNIAGIVIAALGRIGLTAFGWNNDLILIGGFLMIAFCLASLKDIMQQREHNKSVDTYFK